MGSSRQFKVTPAALSSRPLDGSARCDVLVIGAGHAGVQAARTAAERGARVLVVERSTNLAQLPTTANRRRSGSASMASAGWGGTAMRSTSTRAGAPVAPGGEPHPAAALAPNPLQSAALLQEHGTLRARAGHTALELLVDAQGAVCGAAGVSGAQEVPWEVIAGAVVLCSRESLLMAVEAGAQLQGMDSGHGGLLLRTDGSGATTLDGLHAAGSAAWGDQAPGAGLPRGTPAQVLLSGQLAGTGAALAALDQARWPGEVHAMGGVGLRGGSHHAANPLAIQAALQAVLCGLAHVSPATPAALSATRIASRPAAAQTADTAAALARLDALWAFLCNAAPASAGALCATRTVAARVALARWQLHSLLMRRDGGAAHQTSTSAGHGSAYTVWPGADFRTERDFLTPSGAPASTTLYGMSLAPIPASRLRAFAR